MICFVLAITFLGSGLANATEKITVLEDKKTFMGVLELPMDIAQTEALEMAKYIKQEMKFDQIAVRQIGGRTQGIAIQSQYAGGEKALNSILEKVKLLVTQKFGKNTISGWNMSGTVYFVQSPTSESVMSEKLFEAQSLQADGTTKTLGTVKIKGGALSIVSLTSEDSRASLQKTLDEFNNRPFLVEKSPPKDGQRQSLGATEYKRGEALFDQILIKKLQSGYGLILKPTY